MSDRVPLEQDTEPQKPEIQDQVGVGVVDKNIQDHRNMRELSLMLGFDGDSFDGNLEKALSVFRWAQDRSENDTEALTKIKTLIKLTGESSVGKTLLNKIYVWASLQDNIEDLQQRQTNLQNEY